MTLRRSVQSAARRLLLAATIGLGAVTSGASAQVAGIHGWHDPYENFNRGVHRFNKGFDRAFFRPAAIGYGTVMPDVVETVVQNVVNNLRHPARAVNYLLQADLESSARTFGRFGINSVFGLGGIADPATDFGLSDRPTDFGATLHAWNVAPGVYLELPFVGPRSARAAAGLIVDAVIDPVTWLLPSRHDAALWSASILDRLSARNQSRDMIDALLYESPDSYRTLRTSYVQNRQRQLDKDILEENLEDPYAE